MNSENKDEAASREQAEPSISIDRIYLKDLSFESPRPPEQLENQAEKLALNLQVQTESRAMGEDRYEVILGMTVIAQGDESKETFYLIEIKQCGLFRISGFSSEELEVALKVYCANMLFPYAREVISGMAERGGFPQLLLRPINFEAFYQQQMEQRRVNISEAGRGT